MEYTVWRDGVLLGRTELAMPNPHPRMRVGQLTTTPDFGRAWAECGPIVEEYVAAGAAVTGSIAEWPAAAPNARPEERARQVYDWLSAHPGAARLRAAHEALTALRLELRDPAGHPVPTALLMIQEVRPPDWIPPSTIEHMVTEARDAGLDVEVPTYIIVVQVMADDDGDGVASPTA